MVAATIGLAVVYVTLGASQQWDFETYYFAASAVRSGLNPYDLGSLSAVAGRQVELPFLYPPVALSPFLPLSHLSLEHASLLWLGLKCILALSLLWIWWREFVRKTGMSLYLYIPIALFGFDVALLWDLRTGNIALVEAMLLWLGVLGYLRGRYWVSATLIAFASVFKVYPILFLLLFLTPQTSVRSRILPMITGVVILGLLVLLPLPSFGSWISAMVHSVSGDRPLPDVNPSALGVLDWALSPIVASAPHTSWVAPALYLLFVIALLLGSSRALRRAWASPHAMDRVITALLLWFLLSPRVMVYSYASAVAPSLLVLHRRIATPSLRAGACSLLVMQALVRFAPGHPPIWVGAASFVLILGIWILWVQPTRLPGTPDQSLPEVAT
ncbi:MAG TPA: glycosyltransferase family 87 protein [Nitrospiraceae bacterium]|nr:glycosyltransferase family 87 protein [Nitrospiraceae bacterium]